MLRRRRSYFAFALTLVAVVALVAVTPTPYWLIAPGSAVDLSRSVLVQGHPPPRDRYYLTDVTLVRASALLLVAGLFPGVRVVRQDALIPSGESPVGYDRFLADSMKESQQIAAVVAERAAGFHVVDPPSSVVVAGILPTSLARGTLAVGDVVVAVEGRPIAQPHDVASILDRIGTSRPVSVEVRRDGHAHVFGIRPIRTAKGVRLGLLLETRSLPADLPVPIRYSLSNVEGSSGGLMFALQVYAALRGGKHGARRAIAGTGTLRYDGTVGPIQGTEQKLIAAKRAGASLFFVPKQNYTEVAAEHDLRIVPVGSFREALAALRS
ncbi:MAG: S16 family serine protease [Vulcanimicrobiaceae bacterium]